MRPAGRKDDGRAHIFALLAGAEEISGKMENVLIRLRKEGTPPAAKKSLVI